MGVHVLRIKVTHGPGAPVSRKPGFTILELMVVLSIIALLVAMLLPALKEARRMAQRAVCAGQLRQIGIATELYANDYDGWFPPSERSYRHVIRFTEHGPVMQHFVDNYLNADPRVLMDPATVYGDSPSETDPDFPTDFHEGNTPLNWGYTKYAGTLQPHHWNGAGDRYSHYRPDPGGPPVYHLTTYKNRTEFHKDWKKNLQGDPYFPRQPSDIAMWACEYGPNSATHTESSYVPSVKVEDLGLPSIYVYKCLPPDPRIRGKNEVLADGHVEWHNANEDTMYTCYHGTRDLFIWDRVR
jgi:prepilin-type N-terminal cleavage/methylation domain-containing protein